MAPTDLVAHDSLHYSLTMFQGVVEKKVVRIGGFGSFYSATSKATTGRNPRTGEAIQVPEKERVKFRAYNEFKKSVAGS